MYESIIKGQFWLFDLSTQKVHGALWGMYMFLVKYGVNLQVYCFACSNYKNTDIGLPGSFVSIWHTTLIVFSAIIFKLLFVRARVRGHKRHFQKRQLQNWMSQISRIKTHKWINQNSCTSFCMSYQLNLLMML